jgi:hypothetical protein
VPFEGLWWRGAPVGEVDVGRRRHPVIDPSWPPGESPSSLATHPTKARTTS